MVEKQTEMGDQHFKGDGLPGREIQTSEQTNGDKEVRDIEGQDWQRGAGEYQRKRRENRNRK